MVLLEKMGMHTISSGNYVTSVNGMIHPDRIMKEHDFLYMLDGSWEICEDHETYQMQTNDLLILPAGRHHYGQKLCNPGNRHMYLHVQPTPAESLPSASFSPIPLFLSVSAALSVRYAHPPAYAGNDFSHLVPDPGTGKPPFSAVFPAVM